MLCIKRKYVAYFTLSSHPFCIANLPDITMQMRQRKDSKSSVERSLLIDASNALREAGLAELLGGAVLQDRSKLINLIAHPSKIETFSEGELALEFLEKVYESFVSKVETQFCPGNEERQAISAVLAEVKSKQAQDVVKSMVFRFGLSGCSTLIERVGLSQAGLLKDLVVSSCEIYH